MNLIPRYVNLHVTLICLSAKMEPGVFIVKGSVMVYHIVMTGQISLLPNVTCVRIPSCSGVQVLVGMFAWIRDLCAMVRHIVTTGQMS